MQVLEASENGKFFGINLHGEMKGKPHQKLTYNILLYPDRIDETTFITTKRYQYVSSEVICLFL